MPVHLDDIVDSSTVRWVRPSHIPPRGRSLTIGWILNLPNGGSGGSATVMRMVQALEAAGHRCVLHVYERDRFTTDVYARAVAQGWPGAKAQVVDACAGLQPADAYIATSWDTAHLLGKHGSMPGRRLYFVQDYEPYFYPRGAEYALAEDTYRFGYRTIALGRGLAALLREQHRVPVDQIRFGSDLSAYRLTNTGKRRGVVAYVRGRTARRGTSLALLAMQDFHRLHPDQEIHLFGEPDVHPPFPAHIHGTLSPGKLAELYNHCIAGLVLSFTNVSLVPFEMLACGVIPVVNEQPYSRSELSNPAVRWAQATPSALAQELSAAVSSRDAGNAARFAADGVDAHGWRETAAEFVKIVEAEVFQLHCRPTRAGLVVAEAD